jgi:hypothetical protein
VFGFGLERGTKAHFFCVERVDHDVAFSLSPTEARYVEQVGKVWRERGEPFSGAYEEEARQVNMKAGIEEGKGRGQKQHHWGGGRGGGQKVEGEGRGEERER